MPKIKINKEKCIGCGLCASICEISFEIKDDGKAHAKTPSVKKTTCEKEAADSCPVKAISVS